MLSVWRVVLLSECITTLMTRRPSRTAVALRQYPAALMVPVLKPSAPS